MITLDRLEKKIDAIGENSLTTLKGLKDVMQSQVVLAESQGKLLAALNEISGKLTTLTVSCAALNGNHSGLRAQLNELAVELGAARGTRHECHLDLQAGIISLKGQIQGLGDVLVDEIRQCFLASQITKGILPKQEVVTEAKTKPWTYSQCGQINARKRKRK